MKSFKKSEFSNALDGAEDDVLFEESKSPDNNDNNDERG